MFADTSKVLAAAVAIVVVMFAGSSVAFAQAQAQSSAGITILESLEVTEQQAMDFGYVHRPSSGENTLELSYDDDSVIAQGSGDAHLVDGTSSSGLYQVAGSPDRAIQMSVSADDFEDSSIVLESAFIEGPDSEAVGYLDGSGQFTAGVGGVVTIDSDASLGQHDTDVFVTVEYE